MAGTQSGTFRMGYYTVASIQSVPGSIATAATIIKGKITNLLIVTRLQAVWR
jgi:hypothetical protein